MARILNYFIITPFQLTMNARSFLIIVLLFSTSVLSIYAQRGKKNKNALPDTSNIVVSDRLKSEAAFLDGMKYFMLEEYDKAIENYRKALKIDKKNPAAHFQIGRAQLASENSEEAFYSVEQAIKLDPKNSFYYTFLAELYESKRQFDQAIKTYETLLKEVEETRKSYEALALLHMQQGAYDRALATLNKIETKYGPSLDVMRRRQLIYLQEQRMDKAIEEGWKIIENFPDVTPYVLQQADMLLNQGKDVEAKKLLEELLEREPNTPEAYLLLADIYR
ncbi:MAG: tetratricopeptide repeat protein, partial [Bacteroidota bacterium]